METKPLRYGVLGTGNIARQFAEGVAGSRRSVVSAVASRSIENADAFGDAHGVANRHPTYDALLDDDTVDAVYISLPNTLHHDWAVRCLGAGRHVLCEKPIASTAAEAEAMFDAAERAGRVLMEAFMYRMHPLTKTVVDRVRGGAIGRVKLIRTSFCYRTHKTDPADNIRFDPKLAGGALMDIGCYCISFARLIAAAEPTSIRVAGHVHDTGVDDYAAGTLGFADGTVATFACGMTLQADNAALICGEDGWVEVPVPWKPPVDGAVAYVKGQTPPRQDHADAPPPGPEELRVDAPAPLYGMEADAFAAVVLEGAELPVTRADTVGNMRVLDEVRRQVGLAY